MFLTLHKVYSFTSGWTQFSKSFQPGIIPSKNDNSSKDILDFCSAEVVQVLQWDKSIQSYLVAIADYPATHNSHIQGFLRTIIHCLLQGLLLQGLSDHSL